jgi:DNA-directed RNA polymerase sigma subunit (sigma70/sigma32)
VVPDFVAIFLAIAEDEESPYPMMSDVERTILRRRFGVPPTTLRNLAKELDLSTDDVRQIENDLLRDIPAR